VIFGRLRVAPLLGAGAAVDGCSLPAGAGGAARGARPRAALTYQVVAALSATPGRGSGRTTGRMWLWRPVRFRADMAWSPPEVVRSV